MLLKLPIKNDKEFIQVGINVNSSFQYQLIVHKNLSDGYSNLQSVPVERPLWVRCRAQAMADKMMRSTFWQRPKQSRNRDEAQRP